MLCLFISLPQSPSGKQEVSSPACIEPLTLLPDCHPWWPQTSPLPPLPAMISRSADSGQGRLWASTPGVCLQPYSLWYGVMVVSVLSARVANRSCLEVGSLSSCLCLWSCFTVWNIFGYEWFSACTSMNHWNNQLINHWQTSTTHIAIFLAKSTKKVCKTNKYAANWKYQGP